MEHPNNDSRRTAGQPRPVLLQAHASHGLLSPGIALALALATITCYAGLATPDGTGSAQAGTGEQISGKLPKEAVKSFVALAEKGEIDKMVLYYRRWEQPEVHSITEETLIRAPDLEVTHRGSMLQEQVLVLAKVLDAQALGRIRRKSLYPDEVVDFSLGFICYSNEKEVIRVAISKRPAILSVNGERFMLPPEVMYGIRPLLPGMVYEAMLAHIVTQWAPIVPYHDPNAVLKRLQQMQQGTDTTDSHRVLD